MDNNIRIIYDAPNIVGIPILLRYYTQYLPELYLQIADNIHKLIFSARKFKVLRISTFEKKNKNYRELF